MNKPTYEQLEAEVAEQLKLCHEDWANVCKVFRSDGCHLNPEELIPMVKQAFDKAAILDAMIAAGPVRYESRMPEHEGERFDWIAATKVFYDSVVGSSEYETRALYALPSQEKCDAQLD